LSFGFSIDAAARRRLPRIVVAALAMGGLLWLMGRLLLPLTGSAHDLAQAVVLMVLLAGGIAVYGLFLALFGITTWNDAVRAIRQTAPSDLRD
jgi:putative peptidoglycan lipid II flippase